MKIITTADGFDHTLNRGTAKKPRRIFTAGPTPRPGEKWTSWRQNDLLDCLDDLGYEGEVYSPEPFIEIGKSYVLPIEVWKQLWEIYKIPIQERDFRDKFHVKNKEMARTLQTKWERYYLYGPERVDVILFWVPRRLAEFKSLWSYMESLPLLVKIADVLQEAYREFKMQALAGTTNIEFGESIGELKTLQKHGIQPTFDVVYGRPPEAHRMGYLDELYDEVLGRKPSMTLYETCQNAMIAADNIFKLRN